jgi:hypothetical protein
MVESVKQKRRIQKPFLSIKSHNILYIIFFFFRGMPLLQGHFSTLTKLFNFLGVKADNELSQHKHNVGI